MTAYASLQDFVLAFPSEDDYATHYQITHFQTQSRSDRLKVITEERRYWVQVFTPETWQRFLDVGAKVTGFRDTRWNHIQNLKPGDYLLCYLSRISKWVGILEVESEPYLDTTRIWDEELFPCRADVKLLTALSLDRAIPIQQMKGQLSIFQAKNWSLYLISSPSRWSVSDGKAVMKAILETKNKS